MILSESSWPELDARSPGILILPLGATEQHGPHLPLSTDTLLAGRVSAAVQLLRPDADLAPAVAIGASGEHADFPGTLSIGTTGLTQLLVELVRHTSRYWAAVLLVNGHGGNLEAIRAAVRRCEDEGRRLAVAHLAELGMDAHAGRAETSMMLHLAPHLVHLDAMEVGRTEQIAELMPDLRRLGVRALSANGVLGDPRSATAAEGRILFESLVRRAIDVFDTAASEIQTDNRSV